MWDFLLKLTQSDNAAFQHFLSIHPCHIINPHEGEKTLLEMKRMQEIQQKKSKTKKIYKTKNIFLKKTY